MNKIKIVIADDHNIFLDGLKLLLKTQSDFEVTSQVYDNEALILSVQKAQPDLVIMDYHMPGGSSSASINFIKKRYPKVKVVVLTAATSGVLMQQLIGSNADGVFLKDSTTDALLNGLRAVLSGEVVITSEVRQMAMEDSFELTKREFQVLHLISSGMEKAVIAQQLNLSPKTVDKHKENIMRKMNVNNSVQLVNAVHRLNLFDS
ncbi:MAG: response regulator transcription factor [Psychrosphaera sp.]|nr:response regulator transcription factor [Psychrosphaera sp.]